MDKKYIDNLQEMILEDASDEMLAEGFMDRLKARAAGAWAGAKQGAVNAKNAVKGAYRGLKHGISGEEGADEDIADAHATSGDSATASQNARTSTWKKSINQKITKYVNNTKASVDEFITEIKTDAQKLGLDDSIIADIERNAKVVKKHLSTLGSNLGRIVMNEEEAAADKASKISNSRFKKKASTSEE